MKKGKLLVVALIGLMMAGGMVLASCHAACEGAGTCSITVKGTDVKGSMCTTTGCMQSQVKDSKDGTYNCDC